MADLVAIYQNTLDGLDLTDYYAALESAEVGHGDSSAAESSTASEAESSVASEAESSVASESAAE